MFTTFQWICCNCSQLAYAWVWHVEGLVSLFAQLLNPSLTEGFTTTLTEGFGG